MFELINEDMEDCIEILRKMASANSTERLMILAENRISLKEIQKTVELCDLLCYYYDKLEER